MWQPISEEKIQDLVENAEWMMAPKARYVWDKIKIPMQKWQLSPWGDMGGGFWVVALIGQTCIYYNDIEEGFNSSEYESFGVLKTYGCNQTDLLSYLNWLIQDLTSELSSNTE